MASATAAAQAPVGFQSYPLRSARAEDVKPLLAPLLPGLGAIAQLVVDAEHNQLLVSGPPEVHEITRQLLVQLDRPAVGSGRAAMAAAPRTEARVAQPVAGGAPRFVQLRYASVPQIDTRLQQMLARKLAPADAVLIGLPGYWVTTRGGVQVGIALNAAHDQVAVVGPEPMLSQVVRLIEVLDSPPEEPGESVRLYPLDKADLGKVRRAVDAYRGDAQADAPGARDGATWPAPGKGAVQPAAWNGRPVGRGPFRFAHMLLQQVPNEEQPHEPAADAARDFSGDVEVEVLPDLDVIILRGDQREVNEILRIIDEIERLSALEQPQVEVVVLEHAPSEQVGKLLTQLLPTLITSRQGQVSATALLKPNAILLIGRGEALQVVRDIVAKLDQPVDPQAVMRIFALKHAIATTVRETIQQFFANRTGVGGSVLVTADARTNTLIVHAAPRDLAEVEAIVTRLDVGESAAVNELRIFPLRNTLASDLAPVLQAALSGTGSGAGAAAGPPGAKSTVLEFLTVDPRGERLLRSGILSDVRITAEPRTNALVVSAPPASLDLLAAVIEQLDSLPATTAQIKVFKVVNGDAESLVRMLQSLLGTQATAVPGPDLPQAEGETSLAPLRFSVDSRTNSIIATGSAGDLTIVEAILLRLDEGQIENRRSTVYRLKNAPAIDVAIAINEFLRSERQLQIAAPGSFSPFEQIESEVVVVPEPVSNTLILSATPRYYDEVLRIIEDLDAQRPQVLIQVLIAEVQLNKTDEFGVELGLQDSLLFDRSLLGDLTTITSTQNFPATGVVTTTQQIVGATNTPGFNFNNQALGNSGSDKALTRSDKVAAQGLTHFSVGRQNNELGYGGLVLSASSESVSMLIRALKENRRLDVLSRPQVMTLDNQPAFIQVGQRVPRITGTTINQFSQVNTIALENVGLILGVTPRISPDGLVVMEIDAEKSELGPDAEGIPVSISSTGEVIRSPRINTTTAQTTVSAASGQTIILGGLIVKATTQIHRKVPLLGDIPVLGMLFRYDANLNRRNELLIILTPHVVRNEAEAEALRQAEESRINWCLADVQTVHGDQAHMQRATQAEFDSGSAVIYPDGQPVEGTLEGPAYEVVPPSPGVPTPADGFDGPLVIPPGTAPPAQAPRGDPLSSAAPVVPPTSAVAPGAPGGRIPIVQPRSATAVAPDAHTAQPPAAPGVRRAAYLAPSR
ncbi:MAG: hypothetical protein K1X74_01930 [Pirellulales bacterium]|nr:hypothetical protein [Pirellulales bacterium]